MNIKKENSSLSDKEGRAGRIIRHRHHFRGTDHQISMPKLKEEIQKLGLDPKNFDLECKNGTYDRFGEYHHK